MQRLILFSLLFLAFGLQSFAQFPPRKDDHFWRRKVVNRIDLNEKINAPLIKRESQYYTDNSRYTEKEGLVMALFTGLKKGKFVAYHPDSLNVALSYDNVLERIQTFEGSLGGGDEFDEGFGDEGGFDDFEGDDFGDDFVDDGDDWGEFGDEFGDETGADDLGDAGGFSGDFDPAPFENVLHFVENRIFDKNRSEMVYDIEFIEIIWTDPGETLPEKRLCTFRYKDVMETLEQSQWKNRFNDAEYRTFREVFELRMFHSFITDVSGVGVRTLDEAEKRRQQIVEFEHHLWSY